MIQFISIKNFAIIENTEIEFNEGLNIITGETGSGKSIVIEAISLALGSRADSSFVRHGTDKAIIQLAGNVNGSDVVITREISSTGKNLCRLNGQLVTLTELNETCRKLADIHGQYDNQSLLNVEHHIELVDRFKADKITPLKADFKDAYAVYSKAKGELNALLNAEKENKRKLDFYRFEKSEIDKAALVPGEDAELEEKISILQNSEKIFDGVETAYACLNRSESGALSSLGVAMQSLQKVASFGKSISDAAEEISDIYYRMEDISSSLRDIVDSTTFTPEELDKAISRMDLIEGLKKKYGNTIEEILEYCEKITKELDQIENFDEVKEDLENRLNKAHKSMMEKAALLTAARKESASVLEKSIEKELHDLNFNAATLSIDFKEPEVITAEGNDMVEILISTNKGEPLKPLVKIASGGEISRIMLAIKNITGTYDNIPTMIFDEIDAGISGITASIVGRKLHEISRNHQIICITHLPQIAAIGDYNYRIHKENHNDKTYTIVEKLSSEDTVSEIARLLGGETITDITMESARELIASSGK